MSGNVFRLARSHVVLMTVALSEFGISQLPRRPVAMPQPLTQARVSDRDVGAAGVVRGKGLSMWLKRGRTHRIDLRSLLAQRGDAFRVVELRSPTSRCASGYCS